MASKKSKLKSVRYVEEVPEGIDEAELLDELPEISALKSELGEGDFAVRIYKQTDDGSFEKFPTIPYDEFDADTVVMRYGGGKYRFEFVNAESRYKKRFTVNYSKLIKPRSDYKENETTKSSSEMGLFMQLIQQNQIQSQQAATQTQTAMTEIIKAVAGQPKGPTLQETIIALKGLKDMSEPKNDVATELVKSIIPMFGKFIEMGRETAESSSPMDALINKVAVALPDFLEKLGSLRAKPQTSLVKRVDHKPSETQNSTVNPSPKISDCELKYPLISQAFRQMGPSLMAEAQKNTPAETVGHSIIEQAPENWDEELFSFSTNENGADYVFQLYPPLSVYSDWIKMLLKSVAAEYEMVDNNQSNSVEVVKTGEIQ